MCNCTIRKRYTTWPRRVIFFSTVPVGQFNNNKLRITKSYWVSSGTNHLENVKDLDISININKEHYLTCKRDQWYLLELPADGIFPLRCVGNSMNRSAIYFKKTYQESSKYKWKYYTEIDNLCMYLLRVINVTNLFTGLGKTLDPVLRKQCMQLVFIL